MLDNGALDDQMQETTLAAIRGGKPASSKVQFNWRRRRPIPQDDESFENVPTATSSN